MVQKRALSCVHGRIFCCIYQSLQLDRVSHRHAYIMGGVPFDSRRYYTEKRVSTLINLHEHVSLGIYLPLMCVYMGVCACMWGAPQPQCTRGKDAAYTVRSITPEDIIRDAMHEVAALPAGFAAANLLPISLAVDRQRSWHKTRFGCQQKYKSFIKDKEPPSQTLHFTVITIEAEFIYGK